MSTARYNASHGKTASGVKYINTLEKGTSDVSRFLTDPAVGVLEYPESPWPVWARINRRHLAIDNPSTRPVLREMTQAEKDAVNVRMDAQEAARVQAARDGEQAVIDGLAIAEEQARAKGTPDGTAMADRILAEVNQRKAALAAG